MKKILFVSILLMSFQLGKSQDYSRPSQPIKPAPLPITPALHEHKGFYLSMALGSIWGTTNVTGTDPQYGSYNIDFSGTGLILDLKIGIAISENLLIHFDDMAAAVSAPTAVVNGRNAPFQTTNNLSFGEGMGGIGATYYLMPSNIFFSGTIGSGVFTINDNSANGSQSAGTKRGFSYQLKAGKEWFVSAKWGLGVSLAYLSTSVNNSQQGNPENWNSGRLCLMFNATLN